MNGGYRRLHLLVEGQTEEIIVNNVIEPHLTERGWSVSHSIVVTKRPAGGPAFRGGVSSWTKLEGDVRRLLGNPAIDVVTTMFDFYGFPQDSPGMDAITPVMPARARVEKVEASLAAAISDERFVPNLLLHELEPGCLPQLTRSANYYPA